ncbi:MAG: hypothetical protein AAFV36_07865 [Myxococcota bacterium]
MQLTSFCSPGSVALFGVACGDDEDDTPTNESSDPGGDTGGDDSSGGDDGGGDDSGGGDDGSGDDSGGGDDGSGGDDGGDVITATVCQEECSEDDDCLISEFDSGLTCQDGRCLAEACTSDEQCVAQLTGWVLADSDGDFLPDAPCTTATPALGDSCPEGEVCCAIGVCLDSGFCATATPPCSAPLVEITAADIDDAEVTVCGLDGADDATCDEDDGLCENPCSVDTDCISDSLPVCDTDSGRCVCSGSSCSDAGLDSTPMCNEDSGFCECTTTPDDSCADNTVGGTVCTDGICGCDGVDDCAGDPVFDGTSFVCE